MEIPILRAKVNIAARLPQPNRGFPALGQPQTELHDRHLPCRQAAPSFHPRRESRGLRAKGAGNLVAYNPSEISREGTAMPKYLGLAALGLALLAVLGVGCIGNPGEGEPADIGPAPTRTPVPTWTPAPTPTPTWHQWLGIQVAKGCDDENHTVVYRNERREPPYHADFYCRPPDPALTPTPTWRQWLGDQIAISRCRYPGDTVIYRNERRTPPYHADFYCKAPTPTPDAVATRVAATIAAIPTPTPQPTATPQPTSTPWPTPQLTVTTFGPWTALTPTPTYAEWLLQEREGLYCDPGYTLDYETISPRPPYDAMFKCYPDKPPWAPPTQGPAPTPTFAQAIQWSDETAAEYHECKLIDGDFEIYNFESQPGGRWSWWYRCNPPDRETQQRVFEQASDEALINCGIGVAFTLFTGDWTSLVGCLGLLRK